MNIDILKKVVPKPVIMFFYSIIFLLGLISTSGLINTVLPSSVTPQNLGDISTKFQYFAEHKNDYDVIFLGPSTTYQGVIPKVFDETMTSNGKSIKSFNFGIMAANAVEMDFYLQKILALKPANLKWIFLDCLVDFFMEEAPTAAKNVYWHTPVKTIENFQLISESTSTLKEKISGFYANSVSFLYRWLGIGYFSTLWQQQSEVLPKGISAEKLIQEAGYYAMDWLENSEKRREIFISNYLESYEQQLKQSKSGVFVRGNISTYPLNSYIIKIIQNIASRVESQEKTGQIKVKPIFFIPPVLNTDFNNSAITTAYNVGYIPTLFAFNKPNTFTTLYEVDRRADARHLNQEGAQEFTRVLAAEFSKYLNSSPNDPYNQSLLSRSQLTTGKYHNQT
ncbi:MAG: hypothetical protein RMZ41_028575 [Nostoc sp. DedVER02]|uniref:hypothetical protein n=1 Tax=unclassified Nostoc TaxID=2593658 RepID=UPI002AD4729E|nr:MULTISPECIES: hypothetical protein [unclassified Nostoc]MDZ7984718.1 hypothetical protein [Nostoc sp. DedVER02]MDZ8112112.1 hypothetical protein [Nostoc sp. DedVER01b]